MVPDIAKKGHSFNGAFAYYLHDKGADTPAKKDWAKIGASKQSVGQPKDWGKKAEQRSGAVKKAPTPRRDLDRSR